MLFGPCLFRVPRLCIIVFLLAGAVSPCLASPPAASPSVRLPSNVTLAQRIAEEREKIQLAEQNAEPNPRLGYLWASLAADYRLAADFIQSEDAYNRSLQQFKSDPGSRSNYATALSNLGALYLLYGRQDEAATRLKKALTMRLELNDAVKVALTRQHLADLYLAQHKFKAAEAEAMQAYEILNSTQVSDPIAVSSSLVTLAYVRCHQKKCEEGLRNAQQALAITETRLPSGSVQTGYALLALGFAQWKLTGDQQPDNPMLQGIDMVKSQTAPGDPVLYYALKQYRDYLKTTHRTPELRQIDLDLGKATPRICTTCTVSVQTLSNSFR